MSVVAGDKANLGDSNESNIENGLKATNSVKMPNEKLATASNIDTDNKEKEVINISKQCNNSSEPEIINDFKSFCDFRSTKGTGF